MDDDVRVRDDDIAILAVTFPAFELTCIGLDVGVGSVAPRPVEENLHIEFFFVYDDGPRLEMLDHQRDVFFSQYNLWQAHRRIV